MENKIDYFGIIKEAIKIAKDKKILWWFGLLSIFGGGCNFSFNYNFPNSSNKNNYDEMAWASFARKVSFYWQNYMEWIIVGIAILFLILILLYLLGLIGRGALISSIFKTKKEEDVTFSSGFKQGVIFLKRLFLINIILGFSFLIILFVLIFPVIRLFVLKSYGIAILLSVIAFALIFSISILMFYVSRYAQIYAISSNTGAINSIKLAYALFGKNIKKSFIMGLVMIGVGVVIGIGVFFIILAVLIPGGILGFLFYKIMGGVAVVFLGILGGIIFFGGMLLISAILNVFHYSAWIIFFTKIAEQKESSENIVVEENSEKISENISVEPNLLK